MSVNIIATETFRISVRSLAKKYHSLSEDLKRLKEDIISNPRSGVSLGGNIYKVRMRIASKQKGKSGGARVITAVASVNEDDSEVKLLYIYDKEECDNITKKEVDEIKKKNGLL